MKRVKGKKIVTWTVEVLLPGMAASNPEGWERIECATEAEAIRVMAGNLRCYGRAGACYARNETGAGVSLRLGLVK